IANGSATKNTEQNVSFLGKSDTALSLPMASGRSDYKFLLKMLFFGHDRQISRQNNSSHVQPILVGPFLLDRYWIG
ncbi:MAG: hypothetical protein GY820_10615, partial [Gammaproteobacteria bacterium]|nr:hypothetical protein [Gammaproteobacteria bacterium]